MSSPENLGVTPCAGGWAASHDGGGVGKPGGGVNVAVFSAHAAAIEFCLFEGHGDNEREIRRWRLRDRTGDVFHDMVPDVPVGARYGLRAHGVFAPGEGHRFNPAKLLLDPWAQAIDRAFALHPSMFGFRGGGATLRDGSSGATPRDEGGDPMIRDETDSAPFMPKNIVMSPLPASDPPRMLTAWPETVLYELHVRGFTMRHAGIPEALRGRFAGLAHPAAIAHLGRLGVTSVEIMPAAAWIEERHLAALGLTNYWGYNPVGFMAPDPRLAPGGWEEIRATVAALAEAGIETIVDVVLNHSGEGDALGPTLSLRGLDNATYYRLPEDALARYVDDTGCGNTLALDRPIVMRLAMDTLRTWASRAGVHGFRFDLAATLGRRANGFDPAAPLLAAIAQDPLLRGLKLIAEPWDIGPGGYQIGAFPAGWGEWNDRFRDDVRRFWRNDAGMVGKLATRLAGSSDLFGARKVASRSVNFVVAHDGFTLADLVSYETKINAANGEGNRDGTDGNFSWNNGAEGASGDPDVLAARARDQRTLLATLLLARGTPMLAMGAEFGQSQGGNNNAYAQDNDTSWLDWDAADAGLRDWTARLLRLRRENPLLRGDAFLTGKGGEAADVVWRDASGAEMTEAGWTAPDAGCLMMILAGEDQRIGVILHRGHEPREILPPPSRPGMTWALLADSAEPEGPERVVSVLTAAPRSVMVLGERALGPAGGGGTEALDRLALAAGIAPDWWDVTGFRAVVSQDTRRALLTAMRLPAGSEAEARDTLRGFSEAHDRRAVPMTAMAWAGEAAVLDLGWEPGLGRRPVGLIVEREDGGTACVRLGFDDGALIDGAGMDGRALRVWRVAIPVLSMGRHRVRRDDRPDVVCHVTVAPRRAFMPEMFRDNGRRFGLSAQLYALRRAGDQGVGDFSTLAALARTAAAAGAVTVGVNPLHMLFPAQRERASPYHPSDRRFLDPVYLDVGERRASDPGPVAWTAVWAAKQRVLEARFQTAPPDDPAFAVFVAAGGAALRDFGVFEAIAETRPGAAWHDWPVGLRAPDLPDVAAFAAAFAGRVRFHQWMQFLADRQFAAAAASGRASGLALGIYRDLAIGAAPDGGESWSRGSELAQGAWVGAPPDPLAPRGQNWHLPPPIPGAMAADGFAGFAALSRANMRHAGALRIDHVLGLTRLFWIPEHGSGADGAYVAYPLRELVGQLTLESQRARCMVIGEDLGTVPEGLRPVLTAADILSYRVLFLEREGIAFRPPEAYPARAVACVSTHDLPTMAGWLEGADIREREALGILPSGSAEGAVRAAERGALAEALAEAGVSERDGVVVAAHGFVAASPADLVLVQAEDLAGATMGVNLPGTDRERANWRARVAEPVETLLEGATARGILAAVRVGREVCKATLPI